MTNKERQKEIDNIVDLLERAKLMAEEMKTADDDEREALEQALEEENESGKEVEATEEMKNLEASSDTLQEAIDGMDDAIGAMLKVG